MAVFAVGSLIALCLIGWHDVTSTDGSFNCGSLFSPNERPTYVVNGKNYGGGGHCGDFTWEAQRPWVVVSAVLAFVLGAAAIVFRYARAGSRPV